MCWLNAVLIVLMLTCTATDLQYGKIHNKVILAGMLSGMILRIFLEGIRVLPEMAASVLLPFLFLYPFWRISKGKGIGSGDIKMLMAAGVFMTVDDLLMTGLISFGTATVFGLLRMICGMNASGVNMAYFIALGVLLHIGGLY